MPDETATPDKFDPTDIGEALKRQYGEEGAFHLVNRLRSGGELAPSEREAVSGIPAGSESVVDRYLEGSMSGAPFALAAGPYEAAKGAIGAIAPTGSGFETTAATSKPSLANVKAAFKGARSSGRLIPKTVSSFLAGLLGGN